MLHRTLDFSKSLYIGSPFVRNATYPMGPLSYFTREYIYMKVIFMT